MQIREAELKDVPAIVEIWKEFLKDHDSIILENNEKLKPHIIRRNNAPELYKDFITKHINSEEGAIFLAEKENIILGYTLVYIKENIPVFEIEKTGYFSDLYVKKEYRRQGISTKLKEKALEWFKKKGMEYASIALYPDNPLAHSIYKKWGFFDYHVEMRKRI
ncbi:GNAT family N-acetyltransferase [Candidatus Woesearchaeota archaeon]|nr:GNAT family N-acetyltransferase [Candidatus Woesearchaeota archaeon]